MSDSPYSVELIVAYLRSRIASAPDLGVICGSGLGKLHEVVQDKTVIPYEDIPGFPRSTVQGHVGELIFGTLKGKNVMLMRGRFHAYEGYAPKKVSLPVRVMSALGCKALIVTNAAGGVSPDFNIGDLMVIEGHISFNALAGFHPLVGPNDARFGPRFPPVNPIYDKELQDSLHQTAISLGLGSIMRSGCYCGVSGPSYETPHEIEMMRTLGGHAVGMSTVFELIDAAHCSIPIVGVSLISNRCKGPKDDFVNPTHKEVLDSVSARAADVLRLVEAFVDRIDLAERPRPPAFSHFSKISLEEAKEAATASGALAGAGAGAGAGADSGSSASAAATAVAAVAPLAVKSKSCSLSNLVPSILAGAVAGGIVAAVILASKKK